MAAAAPGRRPAARLFGATGRIRGIDVVVLGRTATGRWALLPARTWGTVHARGAVFFSDVAPILSGGRQPSPRRPERDRRGAWIRAAGRGRA